MVRLVLPDVHFPFHDKRALDKWLGHASDLKPDAVDIIGDLIDCYPLSRFDKNPERRQVLQDELDMATEFLTELRKTVPRKTVIRYSEGNHEQRLRRLLWGPCKQFVGLRGLTIPTLLDLDKLRIGWHPIGRPYRVPTGGMPLWFTHGEIIRKHAGATARATSDRMDESVIIGHTHRQGWVPTTGWAGCRHAVECGHLTDYKQLEYVSGTPNWQKGWATVSVGKGWIDTNFVTVVHRPGGHGTHYVYKGETL